KREFIEQLFETSSEADWFEDLFRKLKSEKLAIGKFINLLIHKKIKTVLFKDSPDKIIIEYKKATVVDDVSDEELIPIINKILKTNPAAVADYKSGKKQVMNFLVGQVLREVKKKIEFKRLKALIISMFS
ncbi:hypothetical protein CO006_04125, partial [Candidatus Roizmanbacteria bacterium CG_4_8_14_3_um_filter_35_14]